MHRPVCADLKHLPHSPSKMTELWHLSEEGMAERCRMLFEGMTELQVAGWRICESLKKYKPEWKGQTEEIRWGHGIARELVSTTA